MLVSVVPAWLHKASAFSVAVFGSIAVWDWASVVTPQAAAVIVTLSGAAKVVLEFVTANTEV